MSAVQQLYDFVSLISACCYMDPSRNLTQSIQSSRKPEFFKQKRVCIWEWFPKYGPAGHLVLKLEINSRSMMTSQHIWFLHHWSRSNRICDECPLIEKKTKEVETTIYCSPKSGWYFNPPPKKLATPDRKLTLLPWWRPIIPAFCSTKSLRRRGKPLGSPCAKNISVIRGYFWPKKLDFWVIARLFFPDFEFSDFGQQILFF